MYIALFISIFILFIIVMYLNRDNIYMFCFLPRKQEPKSLNNFLPDTVGIRTCVHEIGHALCYARCVAATDINVFIHSSYERGVAKVLWSRGLLAQHEHWNKVITSLGGVAAELTFYKKFHSLSVKKDLAGAIHAASIIAENYHEPLVDMSKCVQASAPNFRNIYKDKITDKEFSVLEIGYRVAKTIILNDKDKCIRLALKLHNTRKLTSEDIWGKKRSNNDLIFRQYMKHKILL